MLVLSIFMVAAMAGHAFVRRQWLHYIRSRAVESASSLVSESQALDSATSAAIPSSEFAPSPILIPVNSPSPIFAPSPSLVLGTATKESDS